MVMRFDDSLLSTTGNLQLFLEGSLPITFQPLRREERREWIRHTLIRFKYVTLKRKEKTIVQRYIRKVAHIGRAQLFRHIAAYKEGRPVRTRYERHRFPVVYTHGDIELLAETDNLHGRLNGAATLKVMQREYARGDGRYGRLRHISRSRLYDLRQERRYRENALTLGKTKPSSVPIGERRKPEPEGRPGFLRVDTVHQGDEEGRKGVYHINHVDEMTQWEVIMAVEQLTEACMEPALEEAFTLFPFPVRNFHSDNGSEFINDVVQQFLVRHRSKQTKSRPRHSNDNGLAETKNGSIIRKHMGYRHIPQPFAARINKFYREHLIPYLNFHRPCAFPKVEIQQNGRRKVTYPLENYMTPYEKLKSLPNWQQYLRPGVTEEMLDAQANAKTPNQAAREMQAAKRELLQAIPPRFHDLLDR